MKNHIQKITSYLFADIYRLILILGGVAITLTLIYQMVMYFNPYMRLNYKVFTPTGAKIEDAKFNIRTTYFRFGGFETDTFIFPSTSVSYSIQEPSVEVFITKASQRNSTNEFECEEPNGYIKEASCQDEQTPSGQKFSHGKYTTTPANGSKTSEWVSFVREGSFVQISSVDSLNRNHQTVNWPSLIDSLQELKPNSDNLPVEHTANNPAI